MNLIRFTSCFTLYLSLLWLQMYASQYFPEISELLRRLPRVILLMLKTNDCLRAVNNSLVLYIAKPHCQPYAFSNLHVVMNEVFFLKINFCHQHVIFANRNKSGEKWYS